MTRHPPTSSLQLQHTLELKLVNSDHQPPFGTSDPNYNLVSSTPCTLTISYHWEATDNGHPTPSSPAWNPIARLSQFWVPVVDSVQLSTESSPVENFCPDLIPSSDDPLILSLLSSLSPSDFPLPPIPPPP